MSIDNFEVALIRDAVKRDDGNTGACKVVNYEEI